jgi:hypothetical protein
MLLHLTFFIPNFGMYVSNFGMYVSSFGIYVSDFEMENSLRGKLFPWLREHFFCPFVKKKIWSFRKQTKIMVFCKG